MCRAHDPIADVAANELMIEDRGMDRENAQSRPIELRLMAGNEIQADRGG